MAYKLIVSNNAHIDIDGIVEYMAVKLSNTTAAIGFLDDVEKSYYNVVENPFMYSLCNDRGSSAEYFYRYVIGGE